jgi:SAM-dependent methyltransferase
MSNFSSSDARRFNSLLGQDKTDGNTRLSLEMMSRLGLLQEGQAYLGIGAGLGRLELTLAEQIRAKIGYVDPSAELATSFRQQLQKRKLESALLDYQVTGCTDAGLKHKYDHATAIHSWYYVGSTKAAFENVWRALKPQGTLSILIHARSSIVRGIDRLRVAGTGHASFVWAEDVFEELQRLTRAVELHECHEELPASHFFNDDQTWNERGLRWLGYMLRREPDQVPNAERSEAAQAVLQGTDRIRFQYGWILARKST